MCVSWRRDQRIGAVYDLSKLVAMGCELRGGLVYSARGYPICGVLSLRGRPCTRIGRCPHHKPALVCAGNSVNGVLEADGSLVGGHFEARASLKLEAAAGAYEARAHREQATPEDDYYRGQRYNHNQPREPQHIPQLATGRANFLSPQAAVDSCAPTPPGKDPRSLSCSPASLSASQQQSAGPGDYSMRPSEESGFDVGYRDAMQPPPAHDRGPRRDEQPHDDMEVHGRYDGAHRAAPSSSRLAPQQECGEADSVANSFQSRESLQERIARGEALLLPPAYRLGHPDAPSAAFIPGATARAQARLEGGPNEHTLAQQLRRGTNPGDTGPVPGGMCAAKYVDVVAAGGGGGATADAAAEKPPQHHLVHQASFTQTPLEGVRFSDDPYEVVGMKGTAYTNSNVSIHAISNHRLWWYHRRPPPMKSSHHTPSGLTNLTPLYAELDGVAVVSGDFSLVTPGSVLGSRSPEHHPEFPSLPSNDPYPVAFHVGDGGDVAADHGGPSQA